MDEERHRQEHAAQTALGVEASDGAADDVRRARIADAVQIGGALIGTIMSDPSRLFDTNDGDVTMMLWGVERSMMRLQAAMSRAAQAQRARREEEAAEEEAEGLEGQRGRGLKSERPSTVPAGGIRAGADGGKSAREQQLLAAAAARPVPRSREVTERMLSWGDDGTQPPVEINTPITDKFINTVSNRQT